MPAASAIRERLGSAGAIAEGLESVGYISSRAIATAVHVAAHLEKPILVEGSAGVGKTELALSVGRYLGLPLVRLQCYEGLDESKALYEWKYGKQLLYTQILKDRMSDVLRDADGFDGAMARLHEFGDLFFSEEFLEPRPLLRALREEGGAVLLIDEIDKSDEEFEAFLLEVLSAHQVTIPELGTVHADMPPVTFLTSNNTRDLGDALKRRCLHLHIPLRRRGSSGGSSRPGCRRRARRSGASSSTSYSSFAPSSSASSLRSARPSTGHGPSCSSTRTSWSASSCATR